MFKAMHVHVDLGLDESYTPNLISIKSGTTHLDLTVGSQLAQSDIQFLSALACSFFSSFVSAHLGGQARRTARTERLDGYSAFGPGRQVRAQKPSSPSSSVHSLNRTPQATAHVDAATCCLVEPPGWTRLPPQTHQALRALRVSLRELDLKDCFMWCGCTARLCRTPCSVRPLQAACTALCASCAKS